MTVMTYALCLELLSMGRLLRRMSTSLLSQHLHQHGWSQQSIQALSKEDLLQELYSLLTMLESGPLPGLKREPLMSQDELMKVTEALWQRHEKSESLASLPDDSRNIVNGITIEDITLILSSVRSKLEKMITFLKQHSVSVSTMELLNFSLPISGRQSHLSMTLNFVRTTSSEETSPKKLDSQAQWIELEKSLSMPDQME